MPRVLIKHQTGSKAHQTDMLDFAVSSEVLIGRDRACGLIYDENIDWTVSRQHAKIAQDSGNANLFTIENLSGNGTFVDDRRIDAPTPLRHGSSVKFGQSGPSFIFEVDPPPVPSGSKLTVFDSGDARAKPPKVLIRHKTGSKAPRAENLDFTLSREVLIGRDPACTLIYDDEIDKTVGREQAKIVQNSNNPALFTIENLGRTNGTFVDGHKIAAPVPLNHLNTVQFGPSGPSFVFEIDPPPPSRATVADFSEPAAEKGEAKSEPWWVRRATFSEFHSSPDSRWNPARIALLIAVVLLVLIGGVGVLLFVTGPRDPTGILQANGAAVVSIDATWRLFDPETARQAYHWYVQSPVAESDARLPVFVRLSDGGIEPVLILDDERDTNKAIGGRTLGSGSVVQENGFILTGSLVAAPFNAPYTWQSGASPALLIDPDSHTLSLMNELPTGWIPSSSRFVITRRTTIEDVRLGRVEPIGHRVEGRLDVVSVGFSGSESRINAKLVGMSANGRMALIKVDPLHPLHSVTIKDAKRRLAVSDRAYLVGFGLGSGGARKVAIQLTGVVKIADPTPVIPTGLCPGCYQISESGADAGFSGGPVFDDHGRLAGVFLSQSGERGKTLEVVPVEQAADLLGLSQK